MTNIQLRPPNPSGKRSGHNVSLWFLFLVFVKIGCIAFGGFTALIAVVETELIRKRNLLSTQDMLNGVSLAMLLPGPVAVNTVGYAGFRLRGGWGALAIFFPSALLMITASQVLDRIKGSGAMQAALAGIRAAVVGMVFAAAVVIGRGCECHWATPIIFFTALAALIRFKVDIAYIIPCAGLIGILLY